MAQPTPPRGGQTHDLEPSAPLATTGQGAVAMQFITALSKAARSFTLYAPTNAVVRQFLADYKARAAEATATADLVVDIHPFELLRDGEVVYREEDRERSLAFRLFRDGVRRLTFRPGVPWEELLGFLQILAVRYVGIRQQEEDVITLLRKGEFKWIGFSAVEGFTPEEDNPEPERPQRERGKGRQAPAGFDAPFPLLPPPGPIAWREVPAAALAPLQVADAGEAMALDAVRLAGLLLAEAGRDSLPARELQIFLVELLGFLQILAVRYVGIRQQEEDVITLLRKGEFKWIGFSAVEGFTPEEDNPEPERPQRERGKGSQAPAGFDAPFPLLPPPGPIAWREVPAAALAPLQVADAGEAMALDAVRLAGLLLAEAGRDSLPARELQIFLVELRDYFIADAALGPLAALAELVGRTPPGELRDELARALGDPRLLDALLAAVPAGSGGLPPEALRLVPLVPARAALDRLAAEADEGRRQVLALIAEARLPADAAAIVERLGGLDAKVALSLVQAIGAKAPGFSAQAAAALLDHPDEHLQVTALHALEASGGELPAQRLLRLLHAPREVVRIAAAQVLARSGKAAAFQPVHDALVGRKDCSVAEADALGGAMAHLDPGRAAPVFAEWLKPRRGLLKAITSSRQDDALRIAAVSGLGAHPAPEALARLEALAREADDPVFRRHCHAVLARRRHQEARHG